MKIFDPVPFSNSVMAGLIASSGSCGYVDTLGASLIGCISAIIYYISIKFIKWFEIDDPVESS